MEDPFLTARKTVLAAQDPISLFGAAEVAPKRLLTKDLIIRGKYHDGISLSIRIERWCQSSLKMSPSLPRLKCPLFVFWFALFFFPCARFPFCSKNFAPGCPRNDDSYLGRPTASPVFGRPVGLVRSAVLRSPKGGAFGTQRRAKPTTAGLRRPPWTRASPSLGESPLATGDSLAAPTSFWPSAELADWPA